MKKITETKQGSLFNTQNQNGGEIRSLYLDGGMIN